MKRIQCLAVAAALVAAGSAQAAGFFVSTHGGRATAMSTAVVAGIDDASAVFYNPAGLTLIDNLELQLGATLIIPAFRATPPGAADPEQVRTIPVVPPHFYAGFTPVKDLGLLDRMSVGVGFFSPFGLVIKWPEGWAGSQLSTESTLETYYINPEVAFGFWKNRIRIGGGAQIVAADIDLRRQQQIAPGLSGEIRLESDLTWGVGANAGIQIDVLPKLLTIGAHWRSMVELDFEGRSELTGANIPPAAAAVANRDIETTLKLPDVLILGIAVRPTDRLWIEANGEYFAWQRLRRVVIEPTSGVGEPTTLVKNWEYSWTWSIGAEYAATDALRLRAGAKYDNTPTPPETLTPDIPDADRVSVSGGFGYRWGRLNADLAYNLVIFSRQESTFPAFPAAYTGTAHEIGLTLGARL